MRAEIVAVTPMLNASNDWTGPIGIIYGDLGYDLFTLAEDRARLLMELAFRTGS